MEKIYQEEYFRANVLNLLFCRTAFKLKEDDIARLPPSSKKTEKTIKPIKPKPKNEKSTPFLTRAFFNTVAPGLASFAETQKSEFDIVVEDEDDVEQDPDVVAMVADF